MGLFSSLFGGDKAPEYQAPPAPQLPTADQLYSQALGFANTNTPLALHAREGALSDLQNPGAYYSGFQPTSFEQALGNQSFQNIWPDQQAYMMNLLGKSGMASSPVAAQTLGNAYGNLSTNIGQYLNTQANDRANQSLQARLGIDPMGGILTPYANVGATQSNNQANLSYGAALNSANANYANQLQNYNRQQQQNQFLGQALGGAAGFAFGGPMGASIGSSIGGGLSGGNMNLGSTMQGMQGMNSQPFGGMFSGGGQGSAMSVFGGGANTPKVPTSQFMNSPLLLS